jgi:hypothetical protein
MKIVQATDVQSSTPKATIYMDPPTLAGETIGETFSAFMMIKDFTDLYLWQAGIFFDPAVLNCTSFDGGPALTDDVFDVLTTNPTMLIGGTINNTAGKVGFSSQGLIGVVPGVTGDPGVGYKLLKFNFKVKGVGVSDLHINSMFTLNSVAAKKELNLFDVFTAVYPPTDGTLYPVYILTNSTGTSTCGLSQHSFTPANYELNFTVTISSAVSPKGFCSVTIPKTLMACTVLSNWAVLINAASPLSFPTPTENATHTFVYFEYNHPTTSPYTLKVQIISTSVIPEFPPTIILATLMLSTLITVILGKLMWSTKRRGRIIVE